MMHQDVMTLDGRLAEGYVLVCRRTGEPHSFLIRRLGVSVECPECGATALGSELAADYYQRMTS